AAHHVAAALASDPVRADLTALVDVLTAASGGRAAALALYPLEGGTWFGAAAVHARLLAETDPDAAFDLLCQVAAIRPDLPYLRWAAPWADALAPGPAGTSLGRLLAIDASPGSPPVAGTLAPALELLAALRTRAPDEPGLWSISSMLTRRAGRPDEAYALAKTAFERFPSWNAAVALANACKMVDRWDEAEDAWRAALGFDPDDVAVRLDWGDTLLDRWELDGARSKYQEVLDLQPDHAWATPSVLYVDWVRRPTVRGRTVLALYADLHPENERARLLADQATPWVGRLPPPQESIVAAAAAAREQGALPTRIASTHLEAPSARLAIERWVAASGGSVTFSVGRVPDPDPRQFRFLTGVSALTRGFVWTGTDPRPEMEAPDDPRVAQVLSKLAASRYHGERWLGQARSLVHQHGLPLAADGDAMQLVCGALHPPPGPDWATPWDWAYRVIHAAAFVLASQPGWDGTPHRDGLLTLLNVQSDWLTVGAIAALTERARTDAVVRPQAEELLSEVLSEQPDHGYWCVGWPVVCGLLRLGSFGAEHHRNLTAALESFEDPAPEA
ncbi:MAG: tetratricopeptide repeat protein, partial [Myxococcota bacterium]